VRAFDGEAPRYDAMAATLGRADFELSRLIEQASADDADRIGLRREAERLIHDVGRDALIENGEWLQIHRDRPLQVPAGG
jgi:hypothetical protein